MMRWLLRDPGFRDVGVDVSARFVVPRWRERRGRWRATEGVAELPRPARREVRAARAPGGCASC